MTDVVKVVLGKFACFCIKARFGDDIGAGVGNALEGYLRGLESSTPPMRYPTFAAFWGREAEDVELELDIEPEVEAKLLREARKQGAQVEQLLAHAIYVAVATTEEMSVRGRYSLDASERPD